MTKDETMPETKTEPTGEEHTLVIERVLGAPRTAVWRCWTEADLLKQWFCPKPWEVAEADFDLRPGGRMNCVMQGPKTVSGWSYQAAGSKSYRRNG